MKYIWLIVLKSILVGVVSYLCCFVTPLTKITYHALLDVYNEIEEELTNENKSFFVNYSINEVIKLRNNYSHSNLC